MNDTFIYTTAHFSYGLLKEYGWNVILLERLLFCQPCQLLHHLWLFYAPATYFMLQQCVGA